MTQPVACSGCPCGEGWPDGMLRPAIEDYVVAGGIIAAIGRDRCSPEAEGAVAAWQQRLPSALH